MSVVTCIDMGLVHGKHILIYIFADAAVVALPLVMMMVSVQWMLGQNGSVDCKDK